ncbi:MAG: MarR family transcriptional regulator [Clostridia bacterium]|nr:MarR family transcriptional regulator [Clostridia bacterium]
METHRIMRYINRTFRCGKLYRNESLAKIGLEGSDQPFVLHLCHSPGISQEQLAREIYIDKSGVARKLASLEKRGYIRRESDPQDKRVLRVYPTEMLLEMLPAIRNSNTEWNRRILEGFTEEEKEQLESLLTRAMNNAMRWADGKSE